MFDINISVVTPDCIWQNRFFDWDKAEMYFCVNNEGHVRGSVRNSGDKVTLQLPKLPKIIKPVSQLHEEKISTILSRSDLYTRNYLQYHAAATSGFNLYHPTLNNSSMSDDKSFHQPIQVPDTPIVDTTVPNEESDLCKTPTQDTRKFQHLNHCSIIALKAIV